MVNKVLLSLFIFFSLFYFSLSAVKAADLEAQTKVATSSYELFWPVTAGKTIADKTYFLKRLKENIRGLLIFGSAQKANYETLLATKRFLEAEKLLIDGHSTLAAKTVDESIEGFKTAKDNWEKAKKGNINESTRVELIHKTTNIVNFIPILKQQYSPVSTELDKLSDVAQELLKSLK